ncbi:hypothetical protein [Microvirga puerhi]|uniref:Uncharacterized protein n=1 Tax=Microvirga puerhi TaxID=2876078 RepID=A0ABS7VLD1_9HYPH|nr:hypothetical protein [Microvirga puerhi]MBZ6076304.1 hypothetical protein [Microvirga puerhi]
MRVLFEKVLWQVAQANSQTAKTKPAGNKRMEDILRKREAMAGRLTLGLIGAITISSVAFAGYAIQGGVARSDFPMAVPSLGSAAANGERRIAFRAKDQEDPSVTGSIPQASRDEAKPQQDYAAAESADRNSGRGYVVRKILRRGALVEGPSGMQEVSPGSFLPGAGRVISIFKSDGGWVVVTSETVIREGAMLGLGTASSAQRGAS